MSEITLGAAKRNTESGAIFDAKEAVRRAEQEAERHTREVLQLFFSLPLIEAFTCLLGGSGLISVCSKVTHADHHLSAKAPAHKPTLRPQRRRFQLTWHPGLARTSS